VYRCFAYGVVHKRRYFARAASKEVKLEEEEVEE
jgi:hypothetical protein